MYQDNLIREIIVDNFAGGGGASTGIELALGVPVDIAVNHNPDAIAMHQVNHPFTLHLQENVWGVNPREVTQGRPVGLMWLSPDCTHFSKAKGGAPVKKNIRGLAWIALKWAGTVRPRVIMLENVEEFMTWGPLKPLRYKGHCVKEIIKTNGKTKYITAEKGEVLSTAEQHFIPDKKKAGQTFNRFVAQLRALGYEVEWRVLKACDYGVPTLRKRFYLIARCDGKPIVFPKPTHGEKDGLLPYRTAAECIDFSLPCPSIFGRKKPLAVNTQKRIARGLDKFVIKNPQPYIMSNNTNNAPHSVNEPLPTITTGNRNFLCSPSLIQYHSETTPKEVRGQDIQDPFYTIDTQPRYGVNACFISKYFSGEHQAGADLNNPLPTATAIDHNALTTANIIHYYGGDEHASSPNTPLATITAKPRHYLVEEHLCVLRNNMDCKSMTEPMPTITSKQHSAVISTYLQKIDSSQDLGNWAEVRKLLNTYAGYKIAEDEILIIEIDKIQYFISDVGMRMLKAKELMLASGFPEDYLIDIESVIGKKYSEQKQIERIGNAVCPPVACALVRANIPELGVLNNRLTTMKSLNIELEKTLNKKRRKAA